MENLDQPVTEELAPLSESSSVSSDGSEYQRRQKRALQEWLVNTDFTKEVSLAELANQNFALDPDEQQIDLTTAKLLQILKM
jgi:hypothetical protein